MFQDKVHSIFDVCIYYVYNASKLLPFDHDHFLTYTLALVWDEFTPQELQTSFMKSSSYY